MGTVRTNRLNMKLLLALGFLAFWLLPMPQWQSCLAKSNVMELCAQLDVAQRGTGTAAPTTCTVPPLPLTVLLLLLRRSLLSWLPRSNVMELCAQLDVAQNKTGTAALTTCTVLPPLLTVLLLLPRLN